MNENPTNAGQLTLTAVANNRYMDDLLLTSDSVNDLETFSRESALLFQSRDFKLRKWVANRQSKSILSNIPKKDLGFVLLMDMVMKRMIKLFKNSLGSRFFHIK